MPPQLIAGTPLRDALRGKPLSHMASDEGFAAGK
jgi:hypothetical protein